MSIRSRLSRLAPYDAACAGLLAATDLKFEYHAGVKAAYELLTFWVMQGCFSLAAYEFQQRTNWRRSAYDTKIKRAIYFGAAVAIVLSYSIATEETAARSRAVPPRAPAPLTTTPHP